MADLVDLTPRLAKLAAFRQRQLGQARLWAHRPSLQAIYSARADAIRECIALLAADVESEVPGPVLPGTSDPAPEVAPTQTGVQ